MFSVKMKTRLTGLALVGAVMTIPAVASAGVVVKTSGPSAGTYPVGRQVEDSASITLRAGDKVTVLTDSGTRVMQGPGTFRVGEGATRSRTQFSNLTRRRAARQVRVGAVRGVEGSAPISPNLWYVNVAASGPMCLYDMSAVRMWRSDPTGAQTYQVKDLATQDSTDVNFVGTETTRPLDPDGIPLTNGGNYTITASAVEGGAATSVDVKFVMLTEEYLTADQLAQALIENGCTAQLGVLADTLEASAR